MVYNSYQVADIIGVNVSTIKRWTSSGKLNCYQTVGGHRKFHLNDIAAFYKHNGKSYTDANIEYLIGKNEKLINAVNTLDYQYLVNYSFRNLITGQEDKFLSLNNSLVIKDYPIYLLFDKIVIPVLKRIGDEWSAGKLSITEEHLASEIIRKYLANLNFNKMSAKTKYNAFCFTLINDKHDIPVYMAESVLNSYDQIKTFNLGSNLPVNDFIKLSEKISPDIIFISMVYVDNIKMLQKQVNELCAKFAKMQTKIFFKGYGTEHISANLNYKRISSFEVLNSFISDLVLSSPQ